MGFSQIKQTTGKDLSIETLRGAAVILMVAGHVIGVSADSGLRVGQDSFLRYCYDSLVAIRMPLFTAISGYVYCLKPFQSKYWRKFFNGKMRRICLPLICVSALQFTAKAIIPFVNAPTEFSEIWRILFFPFDQFWFLHAILWIYALVALLDSFKFLENFGRWFLVTSGLFLLTLVNPNWDFFSFGNFIVLVPWFSLGVGLYRFHHVIFSGFNTLALATTFAIAYFVQQTAWLDTIQYPNQQALYSLAIYLIGICGITLLFRFRRPNHTLAWMGSYAYSIYLLHIFPMSGSRIVLQKLGVDSTFILFFASLAGGIFIPIIIHRVLQPIPYLSTCLLGLKPKALPRRTKASVGLEPS